MSRCVRRSDFPRSEKKARGGLLSGLLARKHLKVGDAFKDSPVVNPPFAHSPAKRPTSPTSSLEDDVYAAALKAHEVLFLDDLNPLMAKLSSEALGESLFILGKLLDFENSVAIAEPVAKSLSTENKALKNKVAILAAEAENDKKCMTTLEKSLQAEKDFSKLKDKQIGDL
nr:hypothetical protein CFP56_23781 [Quercus suber]